MTDYNEDHDLKKTVKAKERLYKNLPIYFTCENCDYTGYTIVEQKTTYISYVLMILFVFLFGILFSIILMPLVILLTRSFFHKCPSCYKEVGSDNKLLSIFDLTDKVISFNIGEFGLILSRKIILGVFLTIVLIITIYTKLDLTGDHIHGPVISINDSWPTYLDRCGVNTFFMPNGSDRVWECERRFIGKTVMDWKGYVVRVEDNRNTLYYSYAHHAIVILVKMEPTEDEEFPDFEIAIDSDRAVEYADIIQNLNRGSEISFNATIVSIGYNLNIRHFHLVDLKKEAGYKELPEFVKKQGRFAEKKFLRSGNENSDPKQLEDKSAQAQDNTPAPDQAPKVPQNDAQATNKAADASVDQNQGGASAQDQAAQAAQAVQALLDAQTVKDLLDQDSIDDQDPTDDQDPIDVPLQDQSPPTPVADNTNQDSSNIPVQDTTDQVPTSAPASDQPVQTDPNSANGQNQASAPVLNQPTPTNADTITNQDPSNVPGQDLSTPADDTNGNLRSIAAQDQVDQINPDGSVVNSDQAGSTAQDQPQINVDIGLNQGQDQGNTPANDQTGQANGDIAANQDQNQGGTPAPDQGTQADTNGVPA